MFRILLVICTSALWIGTLKSQTPYSPHRMENIDKSDGRSSAYNPYIGSLKFQYLAGNEFSENFLPSGTLAFDLMKGEDEHFHLPLYTNLAIPTLSIDSISASKDEALKLLYSQSGINLGLYPYHILNFREDVGDKYYSVLHWEGSLRFNRLKSDIDENIAENVFALRLGFGFEVGRQVGWSDKFLTASLTGILRGVIDDAENDLFQREEDLSPALLELAVVIPLGEISGQLIAVGLEAIHDFDSGPTWSLGVQLPFSISNIKSNEGQSESNRN